MLYMYPYLYAPYKIDKPKIYQQRDNIAKGNEIKMKEEKKAATNDEKWRKRQTNSLSSRTSNMFSILPFDYYQNQFMRAFRNFHPNYGK